MENKPKYYTIEYNVFEDSELTSTDKLVYAVINNFRNSVEFTYATNKYFAKLLNLSERSIQYSLNNLKNKNYIKTYFINNKRMITSVNSHNKQELNTKKIENDENISFDDYNWLIND